METKVKWYKKGWVLWALLIFMPYVGIPFMWITKKDFATKKKLILSIVFSIWLIIVIGMGNSNSNNQPSENSDPSSVSETNNPTNSENGNDSSSEPVVDENLPDIPLADDFEKAIWKVIDENKAKLASIETIAVEGSEETSIIAAVSCENDESVVYAILEGVKTIVMESERNDGVIFTFGDIKDGDDAEVLLMAGVYNDGTIEKSMISSSFNSARNQWINGQFSAWDGAHIKLEELIKDNLNDEKSFDHIETTCIDVNSEERITMVNDLLSRAGYSQRIALNDLFITTKFSAKNGFGGTVKNSAYGIASYDNQTITLIAIE